MGTRGPKVDLERRIHIILPNPKKVGSKSRCRYDNYREGMTIQEALEAGLTLKDIRYDLAARFIAVDPSM